MTRRHYQGPFLVRAKLWLRSRRDGVLLLAPFRVTGRGSKDALARITIGRGTRIGAFAWFSLTGPDARFEVGTDCQLGMSFGVSVRDSVTIGDGSAIGERFFVSDHDHDHMAYLAPALESGEAPVFGWEKSEPEPVTIGRGVHIGVNVVVTPGVTIGDGAIVGANSVVTKDVDPFTMVAGLPARFIRSLRPQGADKASD